MTSLQKKEFTLRISQANSVGMITILYDIALCYMQEAKQAKENNDKKGFREALQKSQNCLRQLQASLNFVYEPATALNRLYLIMHRKIQTALVEFDTEKCIDVIDQIIRLRDAYMQLEKMEGLSPVMENTQQVYAGLTYGKNSLVESTVHEENRGFLA